MLNFGCETQNDFCVAFHQNAGNAHTAHITIPIQHNQTVKHGLWKEIKRATTINVRSSGISIIWLII